MLPDNTLTHRTPLYPTVPHLVTLYPSLYFTLPRSRWPWRFRCGLLYTPIVLKSIQLALLHLIPASTSLRFQPWPNSHEYNERSALPWVDHCAKLSASWLSVHELTSLRMVQSTSCPVPSPRVVYSPRVDQSAIWLSASWPATNATTSGTLLRTYRTISIGE